MKQNKTRSRISGIVIGEIAYTSYQAAADSLGISKSQIKATVQRSGRRILAYKELFPEGIRVNGVFYRTKTEAAKALTLDYETFHSHLKNGKLQSGQAQKKRLSSEAISAAQKLLTCNGCQKIFSGTRLQAMSVLKKGAHVYCSHKCKGTAYKKHDYIEGQTMLRCSSCKKDFLASYSQYIKAKNGNDIYCSPICVYAGTAAKISKHDERELQNSLSCATCRARFAGSYHQYLKAKEGKDVYCSQVCQNEAVGRKLRGKLYETRENLFCAHCKQTFFGSENQALKVMRNKDARVFCSLECRKLGQHRRKKGTSKKNIKVKPEPKPEFCKGCGKEFPLGRRGKRLYCSNLCRDRHYNELRKLGKADLKDEILICKTCKKDFKRKSPKGPKPKYCSDSCRDKFYEKQAKANKQKLLDEILICKNCQNEFRRKTLVGSKPSFCSEECRTEVQRQDYFNKSRPTIIKDIRGVLSAKEVEEYFSGDQLECLLCGEHYKALATHLWTKHEMSAEQYKRQFGLPWARGLVAEETKLLQAEAISKRYADGDESISQLSKVSHLSWDAPRHGDQPFVTNEKRKRWSALGSKRKLSRDTLIKALVEMEKTGKPKNVVCNIDGMPSITAFTRGLGENPDLQKRYDNFVKETLKSPLDKRLGLSKYEIAAKVRKLESDGLSYTDIARQLGVGRKLIPKILNGVGRWKNT